MQNINVVVITGNLTKDPELKTTGGGTAVCAMRIAVNSRRKDGSSGEWIDKPNYFDVVAFGGQGQSCANYLSKGRAVAVEGRLDWREWEAQDGSKRQAVQIIANNVQFLGSGDSSGQRKETPESSPTTGSYASTGNSERDDIPFARPPYPEPFRERNRGSNRGSNRPPAFL